MALSNTIRGMKTLLEGILKDLEKAAGGNKAAAQRVRTGTIKLSKLAKVYRKESIAAEKRTKGKPKPKKKVAKKKVVKKKAPARKKVVKKKAPAKKKVVKKKPAAKKKVVKKKAVRKPVAKKKVAARKRRK